MSEPGPRVGLFVTCLVDLFRPSVGFAAVKLLEAAGCRVDVPRGQTCCGQPAYNSGDRESAKRVALTALEAFADHDYVVVPSGSCGGMVIRHYPSLFGDDPRRRKRAEALAAKTYELTAFLADVLDVRLAPPRREATVTYHDACAGLRELAIREQPRRLLGTVPGLRLAELAESEVCCGFGGTFCVKYPDISNTMVEAKADDIEATGADTLLAGDLGCLMNIAGKLKRRGSSVRVRHVAEMLAGTTDEPPIGEAAGG